MGVFLAHSTNAVGISYGHLNGMAMVAGEIGWPIRVFSLVSHSPCNEIRYMTSIWLMRRFPEAWQAATDSLNGLNHVFRPHVSLMNEFLARVAMRCMFKYKMYFFALR